MYNYMLAFAICAATYLIGETVSTATKAWIHSTFVTAVVFLVGYWTCFPETLVSDSALIPFGSSTGMYLILMHMGSVISPKQLKAQWKTVVTCLLGLLGMCLACWFICIPIMGKDFVLAGLPPLTGGIVAAITMQSAAAAKGLEEAALFAILMYCMQGFAGYPLTALCLQFYGKKHVKMFRNGEEKLVREDQEVGENGELVAAAPKKKLIPPLPAKYNNYSYAYLMMGIGSWISTLLGKIVFYQSETLKISISGGVWALLVGILFTAIGLIPEDVLHKTNSYNIVMFALMIYIFDGLKSATPELLGAILGDMVILILIGVAGMAVFAFIAAKLLKSEFTLGLATCLTALYGFPPNAIITENTARAIAETDDEFDFLMSKTFAPMIVGGFTTVTITSVILAGIFAGLI